MLVTARAERYPVEEALGRTYGGRQQVDAGGNAGLSPQEHDERAFQHETTARELRFAAETYRETSDAAEMAAYGTALASPGASVVLGGISMIGERIAKMLDDAAKLQDSLAARERQEAERKRDAAEKQAAIDREVIRQTIEAIERGGHDRGDPRDRSESEGVERAEGRGTFGGHNGGGIIA